MASSVRSAAQPVAGEGPTLGEAIAEAKARFRAAGLPASGLDARLLAGHATGLDLVAMAGNSGRRLSQAESQRLSGYVVRRLAREPVSRVIGTREFWGLPFRVTPATLDPRPDTETLVEAALAIIDREGGRDRPLRILDLGTGTGCLLLALLSELPFASGVGTDISAEAVAVAAHNACNLDLAARSEFQVGAWGYGIERPIDLVVSNPPYIQSGQIAELEPEVAVYDPRLALDGGDDGLAAYRDLLASLAALRPGVLLLEVGAGQADAVAGLLERSLGAAVPRAIERFRDLAGIERVLAAKSHGLWEGPK